MKKLTLNLLFAFFILLICNFSFSQATVPCTCIGGLECCVIVEGGTLQPNGDCTGNGSTCFAITPIGCSPSPNCNQQ